MYFIKGEFQKHMVLPAVRRIGVPLSASVSELQRNYRGLLNYVKQERHPVLLLRHHQPQAILLDIDTWNEISLWIKENKEKDPKHLPK